MNIHLYLVRHPQTEWNIEKKLQGWQEGEVTTLGKLQCEKFISKLDLCPSKLFHADNARCTYLASLISKHCKIESLCSKLLRERSFGIHEGKIASEVARLVHWDDLSSQEKYSRRPIDGESMSEVGLRFLQFIDNIDFGVNQRVMAITSGGFIKAGLHVLGFISLDELYKMKVPNTETIHLQFENGKWHYLEDENDLISAINDEQF